MNDHELAVVLADAAGKRLLALRAELRQRGAFDQASQPKLDALLPLVARSMPGGGAGTFTVLLSSMGSGAIVAALLMPRLRAAMKPETMLLGGTFLQAAAMSTAVYAPGLPVAMPAR